MTRTGASRGKLILSGEHAVVAGAPALAIPLPLGIDVTAKPLDGLHRIQFPGQPPGEWTLHEAAQQARTVEDRYQLYLKGELDVKAVVPDPADLFLAALNRADLSTGWDIAITSDLPIGSGLGSSAACLCALFKAMRPDWHDDQVYKNALACEHYQHGVSSGLDVAVSLSEQPLWIEEDQRTSLKLPAFPDWQLYHSGQPDSSTGECVTAVRQHFPKNHAIWSDFAEATRNTRKALEASDQDAWKAAIRDNHRLLVTIGVVPPEIQKVISDIESQGGAAKICGAGSIQGHQAGAILVLDPEKSLRVDWNRLL